MERVPQLVRPLEAENAAVVRTRLSPPTYYTQTTLDGEVGSDVFQAPAGALVWYKAEKAASAPGPGGDDTDIKAISYVDKAELLEDLKSEDTMKVLGVVASPVEDPALLHRHPNELAHLAVYVSGTHTVLASKDDCAELFPTAYIAVNWDKKWPELDTGGGRDKFYVPRFDQVDDPKEAFAMVLQTGRSELRILLLTQRFGVGSLSI